MSALIVVIRSVMLRSRPETEIPNLIARVGVRYLKLISYAFSERKTRKQMQEIIIFFAY